MIDLSNTSTPLSSSRIYVRLFDFCKRETTRLTRGFPFTKIRRKRHFACGGASASEIVSYEVREIDLLLLWQGDTGLFAGLLAL